MFWQKPNKVDVLTHFSRKLGSANQPMTPTGVFALEAERRVSYATQLDSMALDF